MTMTAQRAYQLLNNESLWDIAARCHALFEQSLVAHSICGGVAVCLHGYQRNTTDVDFIITQVDTNRARELLLSEGFTWHEQARQFRTPSGVAIPFLISGEKAGKGSEVVIPDPTGELNVEKREGLNVVKLSRLIEMKLASGMGNLRRTHKDFADVVELILIRNLDSSFARYLHSSLRDTYRQLVHNARS